MTAGNKAVKALGRKNRSQNSEVSITAFPGFMEYSIMQLMIERSGEKLTKIKQLISTVIFL